MTARDHAVVIRGIPRWVDGARLLGPGDWQWESAGPERRLARASLGVLEAADLQARLRGLGLGGTPLGVEVDPPIPRAAVRAARTAEARRQRHTTPGWSQPQARAAKEGRISLTPEALALHIGQQAQGLQVVDACAGAGGNTVGFARAGCTVTAIERDAGRAHDLQHNVRLYGVEARVRLRIGSLEGWLPQLRADVLFADPPWGADYDRRCCMREAIPLLRPLLAQRARFGALWLKLPPSFEVDSLEPSSVQAYFGQAEGDFRRVKFLLAKL